MFLGFSFFGPGRLLTLLRFTLRPRQKLPLFLSGRDNRTSMCGQMMDFSLTALSLIIVTLLHRYEKSFKNIACKSYKWLTTLRKNFEHYVSSHYPLSYLSLFLLANSFVMEDKLFSFICSITYFPGIHVDDSTFPTHSMLDF